VPWLDEVDVATVDSGAVMAADGITPTREWGEFLRVPQKPQRAEVPPGYTIPSRPVPSRPVPSDRSVARFRQVVMLDL
jgi:hypothetical protein